MVQILSSIFALSTLLASTLALPAGYSERSGNVSVTWDKYSWMLNGERLLVHSGEVK